jgi:hypothetical protein
MSLIKKLREGQIVLSYDGGRQESLDRVLKVAFPKDTWGLKSMTPGYFVSNKRASGVGSHVELRWECYAEITRWPRYEQKPQTPIVDLGCFVVELDEADRVEQEKIEVEEIKHKLKEITRKQDIAAAFLAGVSEALDSPGVASNVMFDFIIGRACEKF